MSEDHLSSTHKTASGKRQGSSYAELNRQVKDQANLIQELTHLIQQRETELGEINGQAQMVQTLTHKLQETETALQITQQQAYNQNRLIDDLTSRLSHKEQLMLTAQEQAQLIDDLTSNLQEVEIKLAALSLQHKHVLAESLVKTHMVTGMALGLLPSPLFDVVALSGVQLNLLRQLCEHYGIQFDEQLAKGVVNALITGSLPVLTVLGLSSVAKAIPGIGTLGGGISMTVLAGATIYATGQVFIQHFEFGGTLHSFKAQQWGAFFKQQFAEGKRFVNTKLDSQTAPYAGARVAIAV